MLVGDGPRHLLRLDIVRDDEAGHAPFGEGDPDRAVDDIGELVRDGEHMDVVVGDVLEERDQRSEEHTSELQSRGHLVCRLLLEKKKTIGCNVIKTVYE